MTISENMFHHWLAIDGHDMQNITTYFLGTWHHKSIKDLMPNILFVCWYVVQNGTGFMETVPNRTLEVTR